MAQIILSQSSQRREETIDLVLVARRKERLEQLAAELAKGYVVAVDIIVADLAKESDLAVVEERLRSDGFEVLVNNAGFGTVDEFADLRRTARWSSLT